MISECTIDSEGVGANRISRMSLGATDHLHFAPLPSVEIFGVKPSRESVMNTTMRHTRCDFRMCGLLKGNGGQQNKWMLHVQDHRRHILYYCYSLRGKQVPEGGTWENFCWVCVAGISKPLPLKSVSGVFCCHL